MFKDIFKHLQVAPRAIISTKDKLLLTLFFFTTSNGSNRNYNARRKSSNERAIFDTLHL